MSNGLIERFLRNCNRAENLIQYENKYLIVHIKFNYWKLHSRTFSMIEIKLQFLSQSFSNDPLCWSEELTSKPIDSG